MTSYFVSFGTFQAVWQKLLEEQGLKATVTQAA